MDTTTIQRLRVLGNKLNTEAFFGGSRERTVSRCAAWLTRQSQSGSSLCRTAISELLADWREDHSGDDSTVEVEGLRWIAGQLLCRSLTLRVRRVDDLPAAVEHLRELGASGDIHVLTESELTRAMDLVPGGLELLQETGLVEFRRYLRRELRNERRLLGHELLVGHIDVKLKTGYHELANNALFGAEEHAASLIPAIVANNLNAEERRLVQRVQAASCGYQQVGALVAPSVGEAAEAVSKFVRQNGDHLPVDVASYLSVLDAALEPARQVGQGSPEFVETHRLMRIVWEHLVSMTNLAYVDYDPEINLRRFEDALGAEVTTDVARCYPLLYSRVAGAAQRGRRNRRDNAEKELVSVAQALELIEVHVGDDGVLPRRSTLGSFAQVIENVFGRTWSELIDDLVEFHGYSRPKGSANEAALKDVVDSTFAGAIDDEALEWTDAELMGRQRADLWVALGDELGGEVLFEADGHGHFEEVAGWSLEGARERDCSKTDAVSEAATGGRRISMVALHHELLTGKEARLIDDVSLRAVTDDIRRRGLTAVFLRHKGCEDMRATNGNVRRLRISGLDRRFEAYALV